MRPKDPPNYDIPIQLIPSRRGRRNRTTTVVEEERTVPNEARVAASKRTGRPPFTERRKRSTRMDIAAKAVELFTTKGVTATSAEEIAEAAGVSTRTLWRYTPGTGKENCVRPLLSEGIESVARVLADWDPHEAPTDPLKMLPQPGNQRVGLRTMLALVRLTRTEPGVRAVWLQAHRDAEAAFTTSIAERSGRHCDELPVRVQAAMINAALRVAVEHSAEHASETTAGRDLWEAVRSALMTASHGLRS